MLEAFVSDFDSLTDAAQDELAQRLWDKLEQQPEPHQNGNDSIDVASATASAHTALDRPIRAAQGLRDKECSAPTRTGPSATRSCRSPSMHSGSSSAAITSTDSSACKQQDAGSLQSSSSRQSMDRATSNRISALREMFPMASEYLLKWSLDKHASDLEVCSYLALF